MSTEVGNVNLADQGLLALVTLLRFLGIGADPDNLFGAPATSKLGTEGFEIAIEARPIDHGAKGAGHAYVPPKVRTPLSLNQEPDEPVARAAVPADDRATIKRVFER